MLAPIRGAGQGAEENGVNVRVIETKEVCPLCHPASIEPGNPVVLCPHNKITSPTSTETPDGIVLTRVVAMNESWRDRSPTTRRLYLCFKRVYSVSGERFAPGEELCRPLDELPPEMQELAKKLPVVEEDAFCSET